MIIDEEVCRSDRLQMPLLVEVLQVWLFAEVGRHISLQVMFFPSLAIAKVGKSYV